MGWGITIEEQTNEYQRPTLKPGTHDLVIVSIVDTKRDGSKYVDKKGRPFFRMVMEVVSQECAGVQHSEILYINSGDADMDRMTMEKLSKIALACGITAGSQINGPDDFIDRMLTADFKEGRNGYMNAYYKRKDAPRVAPTAAVAATHAAPAPAAPAPAAQPEGGDGIPF